MAGVALLPGADPPATHARLGRVAEPEQAQQRGAGPGTDSRRDVPARKPTSEHPLHLLELSAHGCPPFLRDVSATAANPPACACDAVPQLHCASAPMWSRYRTDTPFGSFAPQIAKSTGPISDGTMRRGWGGNRDGSTVHEQDPRRVVIAARSGSCRERSSKVRSTPACATVPGTPAGSSRARIGRSTRAPGGSIGVARVASRAHADAGMADKLTQEMIAEGMARAERVACRPADERCLPLPYDVESARASCSAQRAPAGTMHDRGHPPGHRGQPRS